MRPEAEEELLLNGCLRLASLYLWLFALLVCLSPKLTPLFLVSLFSLLLLPIKSGGPLLEFVSFRYLLVVIGVGDHGIYTRFLV